MTQKKKLIDTYVNFTPSLNQSNFFQTLVDRKFATTEKYWYEEFEWSKDLKNELTSSSQGEYGKLTFLDVDYYINHSGEKYISPLLKSILNANGYVNESSWDTIFLLCYSKFKNRWDRLWNLTKAQYQPLENYDMTERETLPTKTIKENTSKTYHNEQNEATKNTADTYGFNSNNKVPMGESETTRDKLSNFQDSSETGLADDNYREESFDTYRELTRHGNIGVTTSQQMAQSEIELWKWNFIQDVIFKDLDDILTIGAYESIL